MRDSHSNSPEQASSAARKAYEEWHATLEVDSESDAPWHRLVKENLVAERDIAGKRILEIGCGRGGFAYWLATREGVPAALFAADFSESALRKAQAFAAEAGIRGISWLVQDIQSLEFPADSFDTVISCETIEHVPNPRRALRELSRVLRPGGRLFLTCPNYLNLLGLYRIYLRARGRRFTEEGQPINQFLMLPVVRYWVARAGLSVERTDGVIHPIPFPGRHDIELPFDRPRIVLKWFARHPLLIARKPIRKW
jgi:2-polyprenyl-3-methyl-5-hydroxy-6-metoxy-1,4-benzoquinol methylase